MKLKVDKSRLAGKVVIPASKSHTIRAVAIASLAEGISYIRKPLVSSDILGSRYGCIADLKMTRVVGGNLVKVMGWYDNEMGYTYTLVDHVIKTGNTIK